ncbi:hypothetical protein HDU76_006710 [Blyttiomyces sp. JEL0837]|nr:hypothetical protein HDU76_006710 [Blyttiomyces sp. JEL0837]
MSAAVADPLLGPGGPVHLGLSLLVNNNNNNNNNNHKNGDSSGDESDSSLFSPEPGAELFTAIKFNFKPDSIDLSKPGRLYPTSTENTNSRSKSAAADREWTLEYDDIGSNDVAHVFKGLEKKEAKAAECVLFYDPDTNTYTLERLDSTLTLKGTRGAPKKSSSSRRKSNDVSNIVVEEFENPTYDNSASSTANTPIETTSISPPPPVTSIPAPIPPKPKTKAKTTTAATPKSKPKPSSRKKKGQDNDDGDEIDLDEINRALEEDEAYQGLALPIYDTPTIVSTPDQDNDHFGIDMDEFSKDLEQDLDEGGDADDEGGVEVEGNNGDNGGGGGGNADMDVDSDFEEALARELEEESHDDGGGVAAPVAAAASNDDGDNDFEEIDMSGDTKQTSSEPARHGPISLSAAFGEESDSGSSSGSEDGSGDGSSSGSDSD